MTLSELLESPTVDLLALKKIVLPRQVTIKEVQIKGDPTQSVILQPKLDGSQILFIPLKGAKDPNLKGFLPVTRSGQIAYRFLTEAQNMVSDASPMVYMTEVEPTPWTEATKHKLAGNLYTTTPLPFAYEFTAFATVPLDEFLQNKASQQDIKNTLRKLEQRNALPDNTLKVIKSYPTSLADALHEAQQHQDTPDGTRVLIKGQLCEGAIIHTLAGAVYKVKPEHTQDVLVLASFEGPNGTPGLVVMDTKEPYEVMAVFGGLKADYASHVGTVIEIKQLSVSKINGAGNPTFLRSRSAEKEANAQDLINLHNAYHKTTFNLEQFTQRYSKPSMSIE